jgi:DNA-directed RNA polymerase subunit RPC12/RpoP
MAKTYENFTIEECAARVGPLVQKKKAHFYQKWSCAKCWARNTMDEPDVFFSIGRCEHCGHFTDLKVTGCNYLLIASAK